MDNLPKVLALAWELGYLIAIPLVVFALAGRFVDRYFGTSPLFLLVGVVLSVAATTVGLYWKIKKIKL